MTELIIIAAALAHFVFLLWRTDFIVEYGSLLGLAKFLKVKEYEEWKARENMEYGYPMFIRETYKTFFARLFGCPFCILTFMSFWLSFFLPIHSIVFITTLCLAGFSTFWYLLINLLLKKYSE